MSAFNAQISFNFCMVRPSLYHSPMYILRLRFLSFGVFFITRMAFIILFTTPFLILCVTDLPFLMFNAPQEKR